MLICRRVSLLAVLVARYQLIVCVDCETSPCNVAVAEGLTHVPREWLKPGSGSSLAGCGAQMVSAEAS